ncbi:MAG: cbb3-type cytochrome c oxidase subunit I [Pseudomonadota bacterium]
MAENTLIMGDRGTFSKEQRRLPIAWLALGITALALAGLFAILLVLARTPGLSDWFPSVDFFRIALVVHVDQSVLIWFLAFAGVLSSLRSAAPTVMAWLAFAIAALGCLLVAAAPFLGVGNPLLNNYVPVLAHPLFLAALLVFGAGILLQVLAYLGGAASRLSWQDPLGIGILSTAVATLIAGLSLAWTWYGLSALWEGMAYYENLFWGAGHVLQFTYTQLMLVAWLWLAQSLGRPMGLKAPWLSGLLVLGVLPLALVPVIYAVHTFDSAGIWQAFGNLMKHGNGLAAVPVGLILGVALVRHRNLPVAEDQQPVYRALIASVILFAAGGVLGVLIAGVNTIIPAHYHGAIVGVTLALMGLTYHLLPRLGFGRPVGAMARWQPVVYGVGQVLHISGLAASGAMGIQRKTAGAAQGLESLGAKTAMGVMGLGGLLAVIGGILFVIVVLRAFTQRTPAND